MPARVKPLDQEERTLVLARSEELQTDDSSRLNNNNHIPGSHPQSRHLTCILSFNPQTILEVGEYYRHFTDAEFPPGWGS